MARLVDKATGSPIQTGAEKEYNPQKLGNEDRLDQTRPNNFDARLLGDVRPDLLKDGVQAKPANQVQWDDLNDKGKVEWATAYRQRQGKWPKIYAQPGADYSKIAFEPNGWVEVISNAFDDVDELAKFVDNYGWGHVHTSFMRGGGAEVVQNQVDWMRNANLWCFISSLADRGPSGNGEEHWRFSIKGLSIPTEQHLELASEILSHKTMNATAFSKHLIINARGSGSYGDRNRVGFETRGGTSKEKKQILDSLLDGLVNGVWGTPAEGADGLKLMSLAPNEQKTDRKRRLLQVDTVPREFATRITQHLEAHPIEGLDANAGQRLHRFVSDATFYAGGAKKAARLSGFDQRVGVPLLNYEDLPWLTDQDKAQAVTARGDFIKKLADLEQQGADPVARALQISRLVADWAKQSGLGPAFGRWIDGPNGRQGFVNA